MPDVGLEGRDTDHCVCRIVEESHPVGHHHRDGSRQSSFPVFENLFREHGRRGHPSVCAGAQTTDGRPQTASVLGRASGAPGEDRPGVPYRERLVAPSRTISSLCARTEPHRIPVVEHETKRYGEPPACRILHASPYGLDIKTPVIERTAAARIFAIERALLT
jgi:hypothetical protein